MNITHILLNNSELGKISKEQRAGNWEVWQTSLHNPDFSDFAKSCGGYGVRVESPTELDEAIRSALDYDGPALVEIRSDALTAGPRNKLELVVGDIRNAELAAHAALGADVIVHLAANAGVMHSLSDPREDCMVNVKR